jgi:hypothetical protein
MKKLKGSALNLESPRITEEAPAPIQEPAVSEVKPSAPEVKGIVPAAAGGYTEDALRMKAFLDQQPKVLFMIPLSDGEDPRKAIQTVTMNGYKFTIQKGVYVSIPQPVADLLQENQTAFQRQFADKRLDLNQDKGSALQ